MHSKSRGWSWGEGHEGERVDEAGAARGQVVCGFVGHSVTFGFDPDIEGLKQG